MNPLMFEKMSPYAYPFYILIHPFDGFQEMLFNRKQSVKISFQILLLWFLAAVLYRQNLDFAFNPYDPNEFNVLYLLFGTLVLFILGVISNWAFCTLADGEGKFSDIWIVSAYALLPYMIGIYARIILSKFMIIPEAVFLQYILLICGIWSGWLVFVGLKTVHDYTVKGTLFSLVMTVFGIVSILFLAFLSYSLYEEVYGFVMNVANEILFRING
jgi:hypothetical protein